MADLRLKGQRWGTGREGDQEGKSRSNKGKKISEQLRRFKLEETYLPGKPPTQTHIQVLPLKIHFASLIY